MGNQIKLKHGLGDVLPYASTINTAAMQTGLSPNLIAAVVNTESAGNPNAVSPVGAQGLMQLMPGTASDLGVTDPFDPTQNIMGGSTYLAQLVQQFNGDVSSALAAYNWGPANVASGKPWPSSVQSYVSGILSNAGISDSSVADSSTSSDSGGGTMSSIDDPMVLVVIGGVALGLLWRFFA